MRFDLYYINRRTFLVNAGLGIGGVFLASCSSDSSNQTATSGKASGSSTNNATIALVLGQKSDPFYVTMAKHAQARAKELGATLLVDGPVQFDATLQTPIVNKMIQMKVKVLIIAACDNLAMIEPLKRANDAGIKVISVDTFIGDGNYSNGSVTFPLSFIGSDNIEGGKIAGDVLIKSIGGQGKVYIQSTTPGTSSTNQRTNGCRQAIEATKGAVTLVGVDYNYNDVTRASEETTATLRKFSDLAGIFGTNVGSAVGISQGVKNASTLGAVKIVSFDAPEQAITDLRNGIVDSLVVQKPADMGRIGVEYAVDALKGNTGGLKKLVSTGFVIINRDNIDTPEAQAAIYINS